jgi:hypothetical protein
MRDQGIARSATVVHRTSPSLATPPIQGRNRGAHHQRRQARRHQKDRSRRGVTECYKRLPVAAGASGIRVWYWGVYGTGHTIKFAAFRYPDGLVTD